MVRMLGVAKNLRRLMKHPNFFIHHFKQIFKEYIGTLTEKFVGSYAPAYARHDWERFFKVARGDIVIDIGAWPGHFIYSIMDTASKIIAIEPEPHNFKDLKQKFQACPNVIVIKKATWNCKRKVPLYIGKRSDAHSLISGVQAGNGVIVTKRKVMVEADTLGNVISSLQLERVDFVKMDIEGAELETLEGAKNVLRKIPKIVIASYHVREGRRTVKEVDNILIANGFTTWVDEFDIVHACNPPCVA